MHKSRIQIENMMFSAYLTGQQSIRSEISGNKVRNFYEWLKDNYPEISSSKGREYDKPLEFDEDIFTVEEWKKAVEDGSFINEDGSGYWVKDGFKNIWDEVFSTPQLDATHVTWFNK